MKRDPVGKPGAGQQQPPKRRRVMNRACFFCRKDHKACDTKRPCERCISLNNAEACMLADRIIPPVQRTKKIPPAPEGAFNPFGAEGAPKPQPQQAADPVTPSERIRERRTPTLDPSTPPQTIQQQSPSSPQILHIQPPPQQATPHPLLSRDGMALMHQIFSELQHLSQVTKELKHEQQFLKERFDTTPYRAPESNPYAPLMPAQQELLQPAIPHNYFLSSSAPQLLLQSESPPASPSNYLTTRTKSSDQDERPSDIFNDMWDVNPYQPCVLEDVTKPFAVFRPFQVSEGDFLPYTDYRTNFGYLRIHRIAVNDSFCNFAGYSRAELLDMEPKLDLIIPKHRKYVSPINTHFFQRNKLSVSPILHMAPKWRIRDGTIWPSIARAQMFYNEQGYTSFFIICIDALTERNIPRHLSLTGNRPPKNKIEEMEGPPSSPSSGDEASSSPKTRSSASSSSSSSTSSSSPSNSTRRNGSGATITKEGSEEDSDDDDKKRGVLANKLAVVAEELLPREDYLDLFLLAESSSPSSSYSSSPSSPYSDPLGSPGSADGSAWGLPATPNSNFRV